MSEQVAERSEVEVQILFVEPELFAELRHALVELSHVHAPICGPSR